MLILVLLIIVIVVSFIALYNKSGQMSDDNRNVSEIKKPDSTDRNEILSTIKGYKHYLSVGRFEDIPVEKDINMCQNAICVLDKYIKRYHNENVKEIYREKANTCKSFISADIDNYLNNDLALKTIEACDRVIKNSTYENCVMLDDLFALLSSDSDIKHTDNFKQESIHVSLYNRADMAECILNTVTY